METISAEKSIDLVLEGGGVRGIAHVGALSVLLDECHYHVQRVAGTSAGAVVAVLLAAGYTPTELNEIIRGQRLADFMDEDLLDRFPGGHLFSLIYQLGIYEGDRIQGIIANLLKAKNVVKFGDLVHPEGKLDPLFRYKVQVIAADLTDGSMLVLPRDSQKLGIEPDDLNVAYAVRMSISVPLFFEPVKHKNPKSGEEHIIVDGGLLCNYPVGIFDVKDEPRWPTFGLKLVDPVPSSPFEPASPAHEVGFQIPGFLQPLTGFGIAIFSTLWESNSRLYIEKSNFARTIPIPVPRDIRATDFDLPQKRLSELYLSGRTSAAEFMKTWNFEKYKAEFRTGKTHSRREEITRSMTPSLA